MPKKGPNYGMIREAFNVQRYHTVHPKILNQTVGHHTANVISTLFFLYNDRPPIEVIWNALVHDVPEIVTGDIPAPAKWAFPALEKGLDTAEQIVRNDNVLQGYVLSEMDIGLLKFADMFDLCCHAMDEMMAGNMTFDVILGRGIMYLRRLMDGPLRGHQGCESLMEFLKSNPYIDVQEILTNQAKAEQSAGVGVPTH